MNTICYLFIYIFEQFISYIYFSNKFKQRKQTSFVLICFVASFLIQFSLNIAGLPNLNLLSFFICNILVVIFCFNPNIKKAFFSVLLLAGLMLTTELLVMYSYSALNNIHLLEYEENTYSMLFQTITTKALYFLAVYCLSRLSFKEKEIKRTGDFWLLFLPLVSVFTTIVFNSILSELKYAGKIYIYFATISFILLFANVFVFLIHEKVVSTLLKNAEYQLEIQKTEINQEYYCELERQYETSNILIHDIKKHLTVIKSLAEDEDFTGIKKYIDSVYAENNVKSLKQFSNNKLINVIVSRYYNLCNESNISLSVDIRNIDFSFINDSDLTSLLNNLLENSYEAAKESDGKTIDITISRKNEHFISFYILNSCDAPPKQNGDIFFTSKEDKNRHGFGIKIINKITKKYQGNAKFIYSDTTKSFISLIVLKSHVNKEAVN